MEIDVFREILVPVIGGLGIFMLGLEFMSNGIQNLAANKLRDVLGKIAGTPIKGLFAGTMITGVLQSSTAMTVMVVGLVNAGVVALRPAISVIMGANIGTTLGNGLIALPLGPLGLFLAGISALVHIFARQQKIRDIALATMGFALIFYGLNLMTGGLKPLRNLPEVMAVISSLRADDFSGLFYCVVTAAGITALIHSSSATIGIVMGLGAAGVLDWQTSVAFALGADLGTTITSWMASLNLSRSAKRAAYAHISFNVIGVAIMMPLFFISLDLLLIAMQFFGGDPSIAVVEDGKESFPLVPVAVGLYSIGFNIFNALLLFPFIDVFERVLLKIGHTAIDDEEDYSVPRFLKPAATADFVTGVAAIQLEMVRYTDAARRFLISARQQEGGTANPDELYVRLDALNRSIRRYTSSMLEKPQLSMAQTDLLASLIEEEDFTASLAESLYQMTRRVLRQKYTGNAQVLVTEVLDCVDQAMQETLCNRGALTAANMQQLREAQARILLNWRARTLDNKADIGWEERGSLLALYGSAERAFFLVDRLHIERQSVSRDTARFAASDSQVHPELAATAAART